jgi:hypothetical protein
VGPGLFYERDPPLTTSRPQIVSEVKTPRLDITAASMIGKVRVTG